MTHELDWVEVKAAFQRIWGYEHFRSPQAEVIGALLAAQDALVVMPTGGGKSLCFQLPALLKKGLTLVVSPLVALMENQVQDLQQRQLPAALLHSELPRSQRQQTLQLIEREQIRLLYLSPETLLSPPVWQVLAHPHLKINGLIVDEAHCLVQWGDTFRPEYRRLGTVRPALLQSKPPGTQMAIAAFTATADSATQRTLEWVLQLWQPQRFCLNPYRSNLNLHVQVAWTPRCRRQQLLRFIQRRRQQSGLVYVRSRRDSESLAQALRSLNYATAAYHAGLSPQARRSLESDWLAGNLPFIICTSAFGMGINKPDVGWIVHFHAPQLLSEYLQEVGRGGRDGQPTDALTLIGEPTGWLDPQDRQRQQFFTVRLRKQYRQAQQIAQKLPPQGEVAQIAQQFPGSEIALSLLHLAGQLDWQDPFHYCLHAGKAGLSLKSLMHRNQVLHTQMTRYLRTRQCRWQFLLDAFGLTQAAIGFQCGHCDNCRSRSPGWH
jgi:ATP-dependent DNA helicase RecQ